MIKRVMILMMVLSPLLSAYDSHYDRYRDGYRDTRHEMLHKPLYAKVVRSEPIYKEVVTYRECRPPRRRDHTRSHEGAFIGGLIGGIIGGQLDEEHRPGSVIGGAVAGAIIGSALASRQERPRCKHLETRLVGYRNIAYWQGKKIVEISDQPLRRIRVDIQERHYRPQRYYR